MTTATTGKWLGVLLVLAIVFGGIFGGKAWLDQRSQSGAWSQPALPVAVAEARQAVWDLRMEAIGTLKGMQGTDITAQVAGNVTRIAFESGARVKAGDALVQLDNSTQLAALRSHEAQLRLASRNLERMQTLYERRLVSQQELQDAEMNRDVAAAAVDSDRALLDKLRITAPFEGVLGIRQVSLGQYVSPGTAVVSLQRWDPMRLEFSLPQDALSRISVGQEIEFRVDAYPERHFSGKITAISSEVDIDTRNVAIEATLPNDQELLRPGLFGHTRLALGETLSGIAIPHTAITYSTFGDTVWLVDTTDGETRAHARVVEILAERGGEALLAADSIPDDGIVITTGQNRLREGIPVRPEDSAGQ